MSAVCEIPFSYLGSKRYLLPFILKNLPKSWDRKRYFEPFLGSGAVALNVNAEQYFCSDIEFFMIQLYQLLCNLKSLTPLKVLLEPLIYNDSPRAFEWVKKHIQTERNLLKVVAMYIYMRRRSTMGRCYKNPSTGQFITLYRNDCESVLFEPLWEKIECIHKRLHGKAKYNFTVCGFKEALRNVRKGDFVLLDPPYFDLCVPTKYYSMVFTVEQQCTLINEIKRLHEKGCYVMLFNLDHKNVISSLHGFTRKAVPQKFRKKSLFDNHTEVIFTNY